MEFYSFRSNRYDDQIDIIICEEVLWMGVGVAWVKGDMTLSLSSQVEGAA